MTHIQQRRDQAADWTSVNPVLFDGEAGHESDTGRWKLGDGTTAWNDLPYKMGVDSVAGRTGAVTLGVADVAGAAPKASPAFTGSPTAPTAPPEDDDTTIATTAHVKDVLGSSPVLGGNPTAPTPGTSDNDATIATTAFVRAVMLAMNPVGSIYESTSSTNPATFIGGTWEAFGSGRMLVGIDASQAEFDSVEETGGTKSVTLTAAQSGNPVTNTVKQLNGGPLYFNVGSDTDPTHRATTVGPTDAAESHTNMPPFIVVYRFRRTA